MCVGNYGAVGVAGAWLVMDDQISMGMVVLAGSLVGAGSYVCLCREVRRKCVWKLLVPLRHAMNSAHVRGNVYPIAMSCQLLI